MAKFGPSDQQLITSGIDRMGVVLAKADRLERVRARDTVTGSNSDHNAKYLDVSVSGCRPGRNQVTQPPTTRPPATPPTTRPQPPSSPSTSRAATVKPSPAPPPPTQRMTTGPGPVETVTPPAVQPSANGTTSGVETAEGEATARGAGAPTADDPGSASGSSGQPESTGGLASTGG
ncbi:hypothetical protein HJ590_00575 [Naumannella sp. ID2617S]|uniref:Uncharacterized protein n=1 Tax=Enemella dayhoffiae TaxID=2016507 RepID=A0A255H0S1_9ACTN|nr:hypothetical protein [Enemella dayhoffiae]NNG18083.1 hypothetical protein [Naumannella sp. ID2617S]OYO21252.1 hypothetical protein CGZ93_10600 [Enemella dayhoffiae]